jgi:hypothetical protein
VFWTSAGSCIHSESVGTKLHQQTRKAISRRKPALLAAIRKYNKYCNTLEELYDPASAIPLPKPLPLQLTGLRDSSDLMEDVWTAPSSQELPRWLEDQDVRDGIRSMLKMDRCREEHQRLKKEADNLCRWWGREIMAVELAVRTPACRTSVLCVLKTLRDAENLIDAAILVPLHQWQERLYSLKSRWTNPMVSIQCFDAHIYHARQIAEHLSRSVPSYLPSWNQPTVTIDSDDQTFDIEDPPAGDPAVSDPAIDDSAVDIVAINNSVVDISQSILTDILDDEDIPGGEDIDDEIPQDSSEAISKRESFPIIWALPVSYFSTM